MACIRKKKLITVILEIDVLVMYHNELTDDKEIILPLVNNFLFIVYSKVQNGTSRTTFLLVCL